MPAQESKTPKVGRKPSPNKRIPVTVRLHPATVDWLKQQPESQSKIIEDALQTRQTAEVNGTTVYRWGRAAPDWIPGLPPAGFEVAWLRVTTNAGGPSFVVLAATDGDGEWHEVVDYKGERLGNWIAGDSVTHWGPYRPPL